MQLVSDKPIKELQYVGSYHSRLSARREAIRCRARNDGRNGEQRCGISVQRFRQFFAYFDQVARINIGLRHD
jgi:hypothetical protein